MTQAPLETEEDLGLVKQCLLLPLLLDILERDLGLMRSAGLKLDVVYLTALQAAQARIIADLSEIRNRMRSRGIRVYEQSRTEQRLEARYLCRGYRHRFSMLWGLVRSELHLILSRYLNVDLRSRL